MKKRIWNPSSTKDFTQKIQHQEFINKLDEFIDQHEKDEEIRMSRSWIF